MIGCFLLDDQGLQRRVVTAQDALPEAALWIDLLEPAPDEEAQVERFLAVDVPTREEMREIESSNRLYEENGSLYMTATVVTKLDTERPESSQITFILTPNRLITNRYVDLLPFRRYIAYAERHRSTCTSAAAVLAGLLEAMVNRIADVLERIGGDIDAVSAEVFTPPPPGQRRRHPRDYRLILERVGRNGDLTSKARETLASLTRLLAFLQQSNHPLLTPEVRSRLKSLVRDVTQMSDHATFLGNKVQFMLEATLGMINIDQNNILKIFSVATVVLLPPSVIGAIFGMNFEWIPTSEQPWGFPAALVVMVASAALPYWLFKRRGWL
ncbi:MAG: magnesium transporter [Sinobacteraceae bacterium]|nr:magnesium transporter [Nevskiaceae bacterium]